jgi:sugar diacid utilization regulator
VLSELQEIADVLSRRLGRSVAVDDPSLALLVHTAHSAQEFDQIRRDAVLQKATFGEARTHFLAQGITQAAGPVHVPGREDLGMLARVCAPVRHEGELLGYLWIVEGAEPLTENQLSDVADAAAAAGGVMYRERLRSDIRRGRERELLRDLLTDEIPVRRHAADALREGAQLLSGFPVVALVVQVDSAALPTEGQAGLERAMTQALRTVSPRVSCHFTRADSGVVLAVLGRGALDQESIAALAAGLREQCLAVLGDAAHPLVGIGEPVTDLSEAVTSYQQARRAINVARVVATEGPVAWWSQLGVYGFLLELGLDALPATSLPPALRKLFEVDRNGVLVETLESYLDHAGDPAAAAAPLSIHRTTLYYRLGRITELTGLDLRDGNARLAVHLGLKIARLTRR